MSNVETIINELGQQAKTASYKLASLTSEEKNKALLAMAAALDEDRSLIKNENALDIEAARTTIAAPLLERLTLNDKRIDAMITGIKSIAEQNDPVGKLITSKRLENGLLLKKIRVPIGVIAVIFESRPNVVADVAALCLKSGNAAILRGGKEAEHSNRAIMAALQKGLTKVNFPAHAIQLVPINDRNAVTLLCRLNNVVDLIIPRGGESLIRAVSDAATVPVIKHYKGLCHVYVDEQANQQKAIAICHNGKVQRPSVCNATESILIHKAIAEEFLPTLATMFDNAKVEMRGDERACSIIPTIKKATEEDFATEYLDLIVSIKIVNDVTEAIAHINHFGSHHSDAIVSEDKAAQLRFTKEVDSAAVYINASTRFTDGSVFGLGAEIGISTDKLHARGPMGAVELSTYKWVGFGDGHIRD